MGPGDLAALGIDAIYGAPLDDIAVVDVPIDLAALYADAHVRLRGRPAAIHGGDGVLRDASGAALTVPPPIDVWPTPAAEVVDALRAASAPVALVGPGVLRADAVAGLHALAAAASIGVLNTWGAKGVFDWRSRHHLATVGLQALDFTRGGLADADVILACGIDEREALADWRLAPVVEVEPGALGPLAELWGRPAQPISVPALRAELAEVTQAGWRVEAAPLPPSKVTRLYATALGPRGLVTADPGPAGYWVARTFPTAGLGGAQVPAAGDAIGFAIACATVARLVEPYRPVLAVVDRVDTIHERLLATADALGIAIALEVWQPDGEQVDAAAHVQRLDRLLTGGGTVTMAVDPAQLDEMIAVAGPVVAWTA